MASGFRSVAGFGFGIAHCAPMSPRRRAGSPSPMLESVPPAGRERADVGRRRGGLPAGTPARGSARPGAAWVSWMRPTVPGPRAALTRSRRSGISICSCGACGAADRQRQEARRPARGRGRAAAARRSPRTRGRRSRGQSARSRAWAKPRLAAAVRICGSISPPARTKPRASRGLAPARWHVTVVGHARAAPGCAVKVNGAGEACQGERMEAADASAMAARCSPGTTGQARVLPWRTPPGARRAARSLPRSGSPRSCCSRPPSPRSRGYFRRFIARWPTVAGARRGAATPR